MAFPVKGSKPKFPSGKVAPKMPPMGGAPSTPMMPGAGAPSMMPGAGAPSGKPPKSAPKLLPGMKPKKQKGTDDVETKRQAKTLLLIIQEDLMPKMRCLHCGRMVLLSNFKSVNEARCGGCGTFILEPTKAKRVSVPHKTSSEVKQRKVSKSTFATKLSIDPLEECSS